MPKTAIQSTALSVVDATKPIDLEKLDSAQIRNTSFVFDADKMGERARAMIEHVDALKVQRAHKAILAGLYLHQVKAALGHGNWAPWLEKHFTNPTRGNAPRATVRTAQHFMALAAKFSRSVKLTMPEIVGANQLSLELATDDDNGITFKQKLQKFVGDNGLTDLMQRHGVLKRGGAKTPAPAAAEEKAAASLSPEAQAYQDCVDAITDARAILMNDVRWTNLTAETAARIEPLLAKLNSDFHTRLLQARHEANAA